MKTSGSELESSARIHIPHAYKVRSVGYAVSLVLAILVICSVALGQEKDGAKSSVTGHYEGTAKGKSEEVIDVVFDLTEKDGSMSGMIHSTHGDFRITGGHHKGEDVMLEFDAQGEPGTITLKLNEDKLSGSWSAGDDGGPVDVKRAAAKEVPKDAPKEKS